MIEILKKQWEYVLYKNDDELVLSVVCGTVLLYDVEIKLTEEQKDQFKKEGQKYIDILAEQIRFSPEKYSNN